ncbi:MAG: hypothetical protein ISR80_05910 [Nitrosopumilus sp.]|nr:hypothetical protein [Nitrosopumilus sp.]
MKSKLNFVLIGSKHYLQEPSIEDSDDVPIKSICWHQGHLFAGNEAIPVPPNDIKKTCIVCDEEVTFYYQSEKAMKKQMMSLDILSN